MGNDDVHFTGVVEIRLLGDNELDVMSDSPASKCLVAVRIHNKTSRAWRPRLITFTTISLLLEVDPAAVVVGFIDLAVGGRR